MKNVNPRALAAQTGLRQRKPTAPAVSTGHGRAIVPKGLDRPLPQLYEPQTASNPAAVPAAARHYTGDVDAHNQSIRDMPQNTQASAQPVTNPRSKQKVQVATPYRGQQQAQGFADRPLTGVTGPPRHGR